MHTTVVRYKTHPQHADQNAALIKTVFEALRRAQPPGLRYEAVRGRDGVTFTHLATIADSDGPSPLTTLPEFKAFVADLRTRCAEPPAIVEGDALGRYEG
jgi:quinol monooxygenase YgiN